MYAKPDVETLIVTTIVEGIKTLFVVLPVGWLIVNWATGG